MQVNGVSAWSEAMLSMLATASMLEVHCFVFCVPSTIQTESTQNVGVFMFLVRLCLVDCQEP